MFPDLLTLGPLTLHSYGLLTVLGWGLGVALMVKRRELANLSRDQVLDIAFLMILSAVAGARVLYVVVEWPFYSQSPLEIFKVWRGGLVFYGGFLGAVLVLALRLPRQGISRARFADLAAPALALGHGLGRIGCFLNGCCYGRVVERGGLHFPYINGDGPDVKRLPTQLWEAGFNLLLALGLHRLPARKMRPGRLFALYMALYGFGRFVLEKFRDDLRGSVLGGALSTSQALSCLLFAAALVLWFRARPEDNSGAAS